MPVSSVDYVKRFAVRRLSLLMQMVRLLLIMTSVTIAEDVHLAVLQKPMT